VPTLRPSVQEFHSEKFEFDLDVVVRRELRSARSYLLPTLRVRPILAERVPYLADRKIFPFLAEIWLPSD